MDTTLYVITAVFNPWRYNKRIKLYRDFEEYVNKSGAKLLTCEVAFGDRDYVVTEADDPFDLRLRTSEELWHKEKMINLAIHRLPRDWKYVAWIDADITFARPDWVQETVHLLQHYQVIQMFSHAIDTGPNHEHLKTHTGMMYAYHEEKMHLANNHKYESLHPGFAWAARRSAIHNLGGLFDVAVLGSADRHMALALIEKVELSYPHGLATGYIEQLQMWQDRCKQHIRKNVGFMQGSIMHYWHGKKVDRRYQDRWKILVKHAYDPEFDLKPDEYGLWQYTGNKPELEYDIRKYFRARNEDSIDVD